MDIKTKKQIDVTAAIIVKDHKVFAARRKHGTHLAGYWEFPGGKLEQGETPEQCLERELQEEFKITTRIGDFVAESIYDYGSKTVRLLAYQVEHVSGDFQLIDHDELRWLALDELDSVEWAPADISLVEQYKMIASTATFYEKNAQAYCEETQAFNVDGLYQSFLKRLPQGGHILDLGCGSGRDSKAFINKGYTVTAVDGSAEIAKCAEDFIGQSVIVSTFQELSYNNVFDGVWASASLLHCPRVQIHDVLSRITQALKPNGLIFMSFKWGEDETTDQRGRYFNNYTLSTFQSLIDGIPELAVLDLWSETKPLRDSEQQWLNVLVSKKSNDSKFSKGAEPV